jgi:hypothetical protein
VDCVEYRRYEPLVSDHRPISARFDMKVKSIDPDLYAQVRKQVADGWFKHHVFVSPRLPKNPITPI